MKSIRLCGVLGRRCRGALCARCSRRRIHRYRHELKQALVASQPESAILWTATISSTPERALRELWDELDALLRRMSSGSWLGRHVDGYARVIEIECSVGGWHPHAHTLLVFRNALTRAEAVNLAREIADRWLRSADMRGIVAGARGQHVAAVPVKQLYTVVDYMTKSHMRTRPSQAKITPAMLLAGAYRGDSEAQARYIELEQASRRRRTWQTGGMLRPSANRVHT